MLLITEVPSYICLLVWLDNVLDDVCACRMQEVHVLGYTMCLPPRENFIQRRQTCTPTFNNDIYVGPGTA